MRSLYSFATFCLALTSAAQWAPLTTGLLSNRSMTSDATGLYDVSYTAGVKKRVTGGSTWDPVNNGLPSNGGNYFVQSVGKNGTWLFAGTESGIYRSNDNGASWSVANGTLTASTTVYANKFFTFANVTMAVFAGTISNGGGIYRTDNNGTTWNIGHSGMGSNVEVYHLTQVGGTLWASSSTGLWKSVDNGLNWTAHAPVNYTTFALASINNTLVTISNFGARYSTDGGTVWLDATGDINTPADGELVAFDGKLYGIFGGTTGCLISLDNGHTWAPYNDGFSAVDAQTQEEFFVDGNLLYCTAIFDIYSITGSSTGIANAARTTASVFPTVFDDAFSITNAGQGSLMLLDATGRIARTVPLNDEVEHITRGDLPSGVYVLLLTAKDGVSRQLGRVIAN